MCLSERRLTARPLWERMDRPQAETGEGFVKH